MKTLKQLLFPKYDTYHNLSKRIANRTLSKVEEWLTQKRQELPNKKPYNHFGVIIDQYIEKELLEDLK